MKKMIVALCVSAIALPAVYANVYASEAKSAADAVTKKNLQTTRQYYAQLIAGTPGAQTRLAELNMLMTMLPKGGDIHHHYTGSVYAETYLDWIGQQGFCIYRESDSAKKQEKFRIESRPAFLTDENKSCLKADAIRKDNLFYRELMSTWSVVDFSNHVHPQVAPDQHFFNTFGYFSGISKYSTNVGLRILKQQAKAENQQYLETMLKSAPITDHPELSAKIDALQSSSSKEAQTQAYKEAQTQAYKEAQTQAYKEAQTQAFEQFADFLAKDAGAQKKIADYVQETINDAAGIDDADFTLRIQTYVSRNSAPSKVFSSLYAAFAASQNNPLIVGVNIVGAEHALVAVRDYDLHMQMFAFLKQRFPKVRLSLHAGELVLGIVPPEHLQHHMRSALQIAGAERIGHGVDIMHEANPDQLLAELKRRDVPVEINLTSNDFILGLKQHEHPVAMYMRHDVPFVISSDDAGVSRSNLSREYFLFASRYTPSYDSLKKTVYNSIRYSFLSPTDKAAQMRQLDQRFAKFEAAAANLAKSAKSQF
ncbi:adenosine deaminase [Undibacterium danionis]|uniref:adenosine deaminase n=1 Tax=Undibacterium danionis TaxID=1812100 RepID=A0ABV6IBW7_9BURK